jgi:hypothetical protein
VIRRGLAVPIRRTTSARRLSRGRRRVTAAEKARAEPDTSSSEIGLGRVEVWDPVDEHRLLTVQMLSEEQLRARDSETEHRDASVKGFDGVHDLGPEPLDVVGDLSADVGTWAVDELQLIEHTKQAGSFEPALVEPPVAHDRLCRRGDRPGGLGARPAGGA